MGYEPKVSPAGSWQETMLWLCTASDLYMWNEMAAGPCTATLPLLLSMYQVINVGQVACTMSKFMQLLPGGTADPNMTVFLSAQMNISTLDCGYSSRYYCLSSSFIAHL